MEKFDKKILNLSTKDISVDQTYQRKIVQSEIKSIVKKFNPNVVNMPKVSFRDGKYYVFDGQHTIVALVTRNGGEPVTVQCIVYYGMTQQDEKELFKLQSGFSSRPTARDRARADFNTGDPYIKKVVTSVEAAGCELNLSNSTIGNNKIICVATVLNAFKSLSQPAFIDMLSTMREAWDGVPDAYSDKMVAGMAKFYKAYWPDFDSKLLAKKLKRYGEPIKIVREGKGIGGGATTVARIILRIYNSNMRKRLEDKL